VELAGLVQLISCKFATLIYKTGYHIKELNRTRTVSSLSVRIPCLDVKISSQSSVDDDAMSKNAF